MTRTESGQSHLALFSRCPIACELVRLRQKATRSFQNGARKYYGLVRTLQMTFFSCGCRSVSGSHEVMVNNYSIRNSIEVNPEEMSPLTGLLIDR